MRRSRRISSSRWEWIRRDCDCERFIHAHNIGNVGEEATKACWPEPGVAWDCSVVDLLLMKTTNTVMYNSFPIFVVGSFWLLSLHGNTFLKYSCLQNEIRRNTLDLLHTKILTYLWHTYKLNIPVDLYNYMLGKLYLSNLFTLNFQQWALFSSRYCMAVIL